MQIKVALFIAVAVIALPTVVASCPSGYDSCGKCGACMTFASQCPSDCNDVPTAVEPGSPCPGCEDNCCGLCGACQTFGSQCPSNCNGGTSSSTSSSSPAAGPSPTPAPENCPNCNKNCCGKCGACVTFASDCPGDCNGGAGDETAKIVGSVLGTFALGLVKWCYSKRKQKQASKSKSPEIELGETAGKAVAEAVSDEM